jgi:hypothetical protein
MPTHYSTLFKKGWRDRFKNMDLDSLRADVGPYATAQQQSTDVAPPPIGRAEVDEDAPGADFTTRLGASWFRGDKEEEYLRKNLSELGGGTVQRGRGGLRPEHPGRPAENELFVRGEDGRLRRIDSKEFEMADIADIIGYIPEALGGAVGAIKGAAAGTALGGPGVGTTIGGVLGGSAGSMAGEGARQTVAELIDPEIAQLDMGEIGKAGLYGAGGEVLPVAIKALGALTRQGLKIPARHFREAAEGAIPQRLFENAERLDVATSTLPVSAVTESPFAQAIDTQLRQSPFSRNVFREGDKALQSELDQAVGGIRQKIGGGVKEGASISSNIDPEVVGKALLENDQEATALLNNTIDIAGEMFEREIGQPMASVQAVTPNLDRLASESAGSLTSQPGLGHLTDVASESRFFADTQRQNLSQLMDLRRIAGDLMNREGTRDTGRKLYAAVMDDLDETFRAFEQQKAPLLNVVSGSEGVATTTLYKHMLDVARRQFDVLDSPLVQKMFPRGRPNVHVLNEAADMLVAGDVGAESVRLLKERLGAGITEGGITSFKNTLAGKTNVGLPETSQGAFIWDQIQQLYLDNVLHRLSKDPEHIQLGGQRFYSFLFGTLKKKRATQEIFGEAAGDLEAFAQMLRDEQVSKFYFHNWSNTGVYNELSRLPEHPFRGFVGALGRYGTAKQFARSQGEKSAPLRFGRQTAGPFIGKEYFQRGEIPDIAKWLHAHRALAGITRSAAQLGGREFGGRNE